MKSIFLCLVLILSFNTWARRQETDCSSIRDPDLKKDCLLSKLGEKNSFSSEDCKIIVNTNQENFQFTGEEFNSARGSIDVNDVNRAIQD